MLNALRASMSFFPISSMMPPSAIIRHDSSSSSPVKEFMMMSTPSPFVRSMIWVEKSRVREEKMWDGGMEKVCERKVRFASVPTVAKTWEVLV
jgi:hypothetical protein